jgi:cell division protein FtsQ
VSPATARRSRLKAPRVAQLLSPRRAVRAMSPRLKRRLIALAVLCVALAAGYFLWLRDSSLVAVEKVTVTGLTTEDADRVRSALTTAGRTMTTLHLDHARLEQAVEGYPVVSALEVEADFPHGLKVHVIEHQPAAIAVSGESRVPVAGDGTILRGVVVKGHLPEIDVEGPLGRERLLARNALGAAAVAGAAPAPLRARIDEISWSSADDEGFVATLRDGPDLILGPATRLRAKWAAAARVLADLEARGATYVDLRIPGRPAVGGLAATTLTPVAPAGAELDGTTAPETSVDPATAPIDSAPTTPTDGTTAPAGTATAPPTTTAPETTVTPEQPLTTGIGGGATAAP